MTKILQLSICFVIILQICNCLGNSQSAPCDLLFPKNGDVYDVRQETSLYNLVTCHFSESDTKSYDLRENTTIHSDYYYFNNMEHIYSETVTQELGIASKIFAASFRITGKWPANVRCKFIHSIYIGSVLVQQLPVFFFFQETADLQKLVAPLTYASLSALPKTGIPEKYDFLEIGTSAFHTLLQLVANHQRGISVEPLKDYLDFLPSPPSVHKENVAIGDFPAVAHIYYFPKGVLEGLGISIDGPHNYMHGLSTIGGVNPDIVTMFNNRGEYAPSLHTLAHTPVLIRTPEEIYEKYNIGQLGYLKLDCEGMDVTILQSVVGMLTRKNLPFPCLIEYEDIMLQNEGLSLLQSISEYQIYILVHLPDSRSARYDNLIVFAERITYDGPHEGGCSAAYHNSLINLVPDTLLIARRVCGDAGGGSRICCVEYGDVGDVTTAGAICRPEIDFGRGGA